MLELTTIDPERLWYLKAREPFSLSELIDLASQGAQENQGLAPPYTAVVLDFTEVDISQVTENEVRRHIMRKSALGVSDYSVRFAYVVDGLASFAKLRMALAFSELAQVTTEEQTFVTETLTEAVEWVCSDTAADANTVMEKLGSRLRAARSD